MKHRASSSLAYSNAVTKERRNEPEGTEGIGVDKEGEWNRGSIGEKDGSGGNIEEGSEEEPGCKCLTKESGEERGSGKDQEGGIQGEEPEEEEEGEGEDGD